jgi:hypothetical protein
MMKRASEIASVEKLSGGYEARDQAGAATTPGEAGTP